MTTFQFVSQGMIRRHLWKHNSSQLFSDSRLTSSSVRIINDQTLKFNEQSWSAIKWKIMSRHEEKSPLEYVLVDSYEKMYVRISNYVFSWNSDVVLNLINFIRCRLLCFVPCFFSIRSSLVSICVPKYIH